MRKGEHKDIYFTFGKHNGVLICDIPTNYLKWVIGEKWFREEPIHAELVKQVKIELEYREKFPEEGKDK